SVDPDDDGRQAEGGADDGAAGDGSAASGDGADAAEPEPEEAPNPFGATREEQCRQDPRRDMNASARRRFDEGVRQAAAGNVAGAETAFREALREDRSAYKAAYNLGVLADRAGNESGALDQYRQALRMLGDYERAAEGIVTIYTRRGSVPDAIAFMEPIARRYPRNLAMQALYAEVLVQAERYDDAWEAARTALRCDERFVPALTALIKASLAQGRDELAESILEQALSVDEANAELHFINGRILEDEPGRFRDALNEFRRAAELRPDYAEARVALGVALLAGGNYPAAITEFEAAAELAPTLVANQLNLADAYRSTRQWDKAKAQFDRVLQMEPDLTEAWFNLALMYQEAGEEFPGLDDLTSLQQAKDAFTRYRDLMGPRLPRDDPSAGYLENIDRQIQRIERRREREARNREREAARAAEGGEETAE
ncbi:MAG: tetratricopeptide repeat protein, partial [Myxococcota bacterium]